MGFFALHMMKIALELAKQDPAFEEMAANHFEHFLLIAKATSSNMWDEQDGFFYDLVLFPQGHTKRLKCRSFVGIIPFYSLDFFKENDLKAFPHFYSHFQFCLQKYGRLAKQCVTSFTKKGQKHLLFSLMSPPQMKRVLEKVFDPDEFLSDFGIRSLSKFHEKNRLVFEDRTVFYEPGESLEKIKGGNSNWRGPIWFPTNYLLLVSLNRLAEALGETFKVRGQTLSILSTSLANRLIALFEKSTTGNGPSMEIPPSFRTTPFGKTFSSSTNTTTAISAAALAPPTKPAGAASSLK